MIINGFLSDQRGGNYSKFFGNLVKIKGAGLVREIADVQDWPLHYRDAWAAFSGLDWQYLSSWDLCSELDAPPSAQPFQFLEISASTIIIIYQLRCGDFIISILSLDKSLATTRSYPRGCGFKSGWLLTVKDVLLNIFRIKTRWRKLKKCTQP